ncbi:MAG: tRNA pseudouridine(54/55) synthase Pus10 [Nitrososphaerota archaeon]
MGGILDLVYRMLQKYTLCDYCLGRQFARLLSGVGNKARGEALKVALAMEANMRLLMDDKDAVNVLKVVAENGMNRHARKLAKSLNYQIDENKTCDICEGKLTEENFRRIADSIIGELGQYEFSNFLIGTSVPVHIKERDDQIKAEFALTFGEEIKSDITRELGKIIEGTTKKPVEFATPDITILLDIFSGTFTVKSNPVFVKGYYKKLQPSIPQTPWICRKCRGKGCEACGQSGREYPDSVSELIGEPALNLFEALDYRFHAAGREDVNVTVLGTGRPFVLELKSPRKRFIQPDKLQNAINEYAKDKVEVLDLSYTTKKDVRDMKAKSVVASKTYLALVEFDSNVDENKLREVCEKFRNVLVHQRTPSRILRRSDRVRKKYLYSIEAEKKGNRLVEFRIKAQGGLYIKEVINGDGGRTVPNIADVLGTAPINITLSVVEVER